MSAAPRRPARATPPPAPRSAPGRAAAASLAAARVGPAALLAAAPVRPVASLVAAPGRPVASLVAALGGPAALLVAALAALGCGGGPPPEPRSPEGADGPGPAPSGGALGDVEAALRAGDSARALEGARRVLATRPRHPNALFYAGVALEGLGDAAGAEAHYRQALEADPSLREAAGNLSALLLGQGRGADARAVVEPLAARFPDDADLQTNRAEALSALGDHAGAARAYEALLRKGDDPRHRLGYAKALAAGGDKAAAARVLREGLRSAGDDRDRLAAFGRALGALGAYADAVAALDRAIALKSGADLLTYRALFRRSAGDPKAAKADLDAALALDPGFAPAHLYAGELLEAQGDPAGARRAYERAEAAGGPFGERAKKRLEALGKKR
ncbi:MAG TPA: tetratricopeptide repeat protein [Polyangiaceae bacterium]|nr:tetratricopeptide repeat protein [Polyangiaceae bacterium]